MRNFWFSVSFEFEMELCNTHLVTTKNNSSHAALSVPWTLIAPHSRLHPTCREEPLLSKRMDGKRFTPRAAEQDNDVGRLVADPKHRS